MNIFGFDIKSKEEREREQEAYLYRIFPGGTDQKTAVEKELGEMLPKADIKSVMLFFILVRDAMTSRNSPDFREAAAMVAKKQQVARMSPEMVEAVRVVMEKME